MRIVVTLLMVAGAEDHKLFPRISEHSQKSMFDVARQPHLKNAMLLVEQFGVRLTPLIQLLYHSEDSVVLTSKIFVLVIPALPKIGLPSVIVASVGPHDIAFL